MKGGNTNPSTKDEGWARGSPNSSQSHYPFLSMPKKTMLRLGDRRLCAKMMLHHRHYALLYFSHPHHCRSRLMSYSVINMTLNTVGVQLHPNRVYEVHLTS